MFTGFLANLGNLDLNFTKRPIWASNPPQLSDSCCSSRPFQVLFTLEGQSVYGKLEWWMAWFWSLRRWFDLDIFCNGNELVSDELWVHGHPYVSIQLDDGCFNTATQALLYGQGRFLFQEKMAEKEGGVARHRPATTATQQQQFS